MPSRRTKRHDLQSRGNALEWWRSWPPSICARMYSVAHVLLGRTRDIAQWRSGDVLQLVQAQNPSGKFSLRRDLDDEQGYYLIQLASSWKLTLRILHTCSVQQK